MNLAVLGLDVLHLLEQNHNLLLGGLAHGMVYLTLYLLLSLLVLRDPLGLSRGNLSLKALHGLLGLGYLSLEILEFSLGCIDLVVLELLLPNVYLDLQTVSIVPQLTEVSLSL